MTLTSDISPLLCFGIDFDLLVCNNPWQTHTLPHTHTGKRLDKHQAPALKALGVHYQGTSCTDRVSNPRSSKAKEHFNQRTVEACQHCPIKPLYPQQLRGRRKWRSRKGLGGWVDWTKISLKVLWYFYLL